MILAKDGIDAKVTDLATQINAARAPKIAQMSGWLAGWGENPSPSTEGTAQTTSHASSNASTRPTRHVQRRGREAALD